MESDASMNIDLERALALYDGIWEDYLSAIEGMGIVFEPFGDSIMEAAPLREELSLRGAFSRNGGASVVSGFLSPACEACTGERCARTFEITLACHRHCYFCFNPNQGDYAERLESDYPWDDELRAMVLRGETPVSIGLTGGEPLLRPVETEGFFRLARELFPNAYLRLYTSGDMLGIDLAERLAAAGLDEVRFSVKLDDPQPIQEKVLANLAACVGVVPHVMVEMPAIPGTFDEMRALLHRLDELGADGINLLEFCYPLGDWGEFEKRGFQVKNPPYPVLYEYGYAGGLPIAGSESLCLQLMLAAMDDGLSLGVHYCSLENKHRSEIRQANSRQFSHACYAMDSEDFFLKTAKVYGADRESVRKALQGAGFENALEDEGEHSLAFPIALLPLMSGLGVSPVISYNVLEEREGRLALRELELELLDDDRF